MTSLIGSGITRRGEVVGEGNNAPVLYHSSKQIEHWCYLCSYKSLIVSPPCVCLCLLFESLYSVSCVSSRCFSIVFDAVCLTHGSALCCVLFCAYLVWPWMWLLSLERLLSNAWSLRPSFAVIPLCCCFYKSCSLPPLMSFHVIYHAAVCASLWKLNPALQHAQHCGAGNHVSYWPL